MNGEENLKNISPKAIEEVLAGVRGVNGAKVIADEEGKIEEIHIVIDGSRSPKQVVRDIESVLLAKLGLSVDHRKISVAQIGEEPRVAQTRLRLLDTSLTISSIRARAVVRLKKGEEILEGEAVGPASTRNIPYLFSQATLKAVEKCLPEEVSFSLDDLMITDSKGRETVVVLVDLLSTSGEEPLAGAALVKQDIGKATVLATLNAINRRLGLYLTNGSPESPRKE